MKQRSLLRLGVALLLLSGAMGCASARPATGPASTTSPGVRCRTVLEVRPGVLGSASNPVPVQQCEPEIPAPAPPKDADEAPLGAPTPPAPSTP